MVINSFSFFISIFFIFGFIFKNFYGHIFITIKITAYYIIFLYLYSYITFFTSIYTHYYHLWYIIFLIPFLSVLFMHYIFDVLCFVLYRCLKLKVWQNGIFIDFFLQIHWYYSFIIITPYLDTCHFIQDFLIFWFSIHNTNINNTIQYT